MRISANIYLRKKQAHQEVPTLAVLRLQVLQIFVFWTVTLAYGLPRMVFSLYFYTQWNYLSVAQWHNHFSLSAQWQLIHLCLRYFQSSWTNVSYYDQSDSCRLTNNAPCISASCIEINIKLNFYFHTSLWCLKRFYEGLLRHHKEVWK